ncbi:MAG: redoxin domain-containing protein [Fimbriimonadaceae bacterium]|nr:redoxin domain-containing protein [Chitinophagales bacterium]
MKNILLLFFLSFSFNLFSQNAHEYHVKIKGMEDTVIYFGHHYGDKQYVIDTIPTNAKGEAVIAGSDTLKGGIYLVVMPKLKNKYFELIINEPTFSLETDTTDFTVYMKFKGSPENTAFYDDLNFINTKRKEADPLKEKLKTLEAESEEAKKLKDELIAINKSVEDERKSIQTKHPELFYAKFLKALEDVKIPEAPVNADGTKDSLFAYKYVRAHFFDNIDFGDDRFLRSSLLQAKIKKYLDSYVPRIPDSISVAVDYIINKANANTEVFKFAVVTLLNDYANSKIMGMDAVYVHMVDTYYKTGKAYWADATALYKITSQADKIRPTLIGKIAPNILLQDSSGHDIPLYSVKKKYTVILFWDVDCSHCKKEMPKLELAYPQIKERNAEVYAVYSQEEWDKWKKQLKEKNYPWINVGNVSMKSNFQSQYYVDQTPMIFIVNDKKEIIAKKIAVEQIVEVLDNYNAIEKQQK